ncbi:MAG: DUF2182 domain-containing protein [Paracoccaceae bacterium]
MTAQRSNIVNGRTVGWLGFYAVVLLAWWLVFLGARGLLPLPSGGFRTLYLMWLIMIAAMILPTMIPTLRSYHALPGRSGAGTFGWLGLVLGYSAVWLVGAGGFAAVQVAVQKFGLVASGLGDGAPWFAASLLALAGGWQFSRPKAACQNACQSPMVYFLGRWRAGALGGARMGIELGLICVGCCWAIMALGFVGGIMNLWWMGLATLFMVVEKLPAAGRHIRRPAGGILIVAALLVILNALSQS